MGLLILGIACLGAQPGHPESRWTPLDFLLGNWVGEGGGPGQGSGEFSFLPDQDGKILIRKNIANYPATKDKAAFSHTDLMIIYRDTGESALRGIYFDSEDHTIHYRVEPSPDGKSVQFVSEGPASEPRYRLTYRSAAGDRVSIQFEIAPPGKPFATYINASAVRKNKDGKP
jgi:hypothetical protein